MSHLGSRSQGIKRVKIKRTRTKVSWILRVNLCDLTVLDSKETSPCKMKPRILSLQGTWIAALSGNGISSKAWRDWQRPIGFSRIGEIFPKMTHTFPMIKSKGLKLQTTNISSSLSTCLFVFACLPTLRFILLKPVIIDSLTALFWRQNIIRYLKTASREIFVCLVFLMYKILEKNTLQLFFICFCLWVCFHSFNAGAEYLRKSRFWSHEIETETDVSFSSFGWIFRPKGKFRRSCHICPSVFST